MTSTWQPVPSPAPSAHDAQMDAYVAAGCPVDSGWYGVGMALHIPAVSTPVREWVR